MRTANTLQLATLKFVNTSTAQDSTFVIDHLKPDVAVYKKPSEVTGTNFQLMEFWSEFKMRDDPFDDAAKEGSFVKSSKGSERRHWLTSAVLPLERVKTLLKRVS